MRMCVSITAGFAAASFDRNVNCIPGMQDLGRSCIPGIFMATNVRIFNSCHGGSAPSSNDLIAYPFVSDFSERWTASA